MPGLVFRRFYFSGEFSKQYFKSSFFEIILSCFFPAIALHSAWFFLIQKFDIEVDLQILGLLISAKDFPQVAFENIQDNFLNIVIYQLSILLAASLFGYLIKFLIKKLKLDVKYKILRFKNLWHYILKGKFFDFPRAAFDLVNDNINNIELIYVDALVDINEGSVLYEGILVDYELSNDGGLEHIQLKETYRKFIINNGAESSKECDKLCTKLYPLCKMQTYNSNSINIPGHILILPYKSIINLNFSYYKLVKDSDGSLDVQLVN